MSLKDSLLNIKDLLYVTSKDEISRRYLNTKNCSYIYILSCIEKGKYDPTLLNEDDLIQEFIFSNILRIGESDTEVLLYEFNFENISIGSTNIKDFHDFDLKVVSKLAFLELLMRSNMGLDLYKDVRQSDEILLDKRYKPLDLVSLIDNDKGFTGVEIKTPFVLALMVDRIRRNGLLIEGIFRKSVSDSALKDYYGDLIKLLGNKNNNILEVYNFLSGIDISMLAALLKVFLRNIGFLIDTNILKYLIRIPDIREPKKTVLFYQCLILQLPESRRIVLEIVLHLLSDIVARQERNKINLYSAAALFAPVLFSLEDHSSNNYVIKVLQQMIHYRQLIFLVPRNVIKVYRMDNELNNVQFDPIKNIATKKLDQANCSDVVLCNFKSSLKGDAGQDHVDCLKCKENVITFKYKKQTRSFEYNNFSTVEDLLRTAGASDKGSQLRLVESNGNLYQCYLHPDTKIHTIVDNNKSGLYSAVITTECDFVTATVQELHTFLRIPFAL